MGFCRFISLISPLMGLFCLNSLWANVSSTSSNLQFSLSDAQVRATLNTTGLGIGTLPSSNLDVSGNAIISNQLLIGSHHSQANLSIDGNWGQSHGQLTSLSTLSAHSVYFADTSSDNLVASLPLASAVIGRVINIKNTSALHRVILLSYDENGIDGNATLVLGPTNTPLLPYAKLLSTGSGWSIINSSNTTSMGGNVESFDDTDYTDTGWFNVDTNAVNATAASGISGSGGLDNNSDGALSMGNTHITIPPVTVFSVMGKFTGTSNFNSGAFTVGYNSNTTNFQPWSGGLSTDTAIAGLGLTNEGVVGRFSLYSGYTHSGLHNRTRLTTSSIQSLVTNDWYRMRGIILFDGLNQFTWNISIDHFASDGTTLMEGDILSCSNTSTHNIGTTGRFVVNTNRDRGFRYTDNYQVFYR